MASTDEWATKGHLQGPPDCSTLCRSSCSLMSNWGICARQSSTVHWTNSSPRHAPLDHWPSFVTLSHAVTALAENRILHFALPSFCLVCQITLCTGFPRLSWKENLSSVSSLPFLLPPNHRYTLPTSAPYWSAFIRKKLRHIWCGNTHEPFGHIFQLSIHAAYRALGCNHCCGNRSSHDWTWFLLAQKEAWSLLLEDRVWMCNSGLVHALKPVSGWITLQVSLEAVKRSEIPSFSSNLSF